MVRTTRPLRLLNRTSLRLVAVACTALLLQGQLALFAQTPPPAQPEKAEAKRPPEQLDSLVAPIALYPDPLLAQTLASSTYPLEIIQLHQWMAKDKNKGLKDKALVDAVAKQPWDPAVQSMAAFPEAVKRLAEDIQWTTDLGNAFLAQQSDVMAAVQRMRKKAKGNNALETNTQQKVEIQVIEQKEVIVIQSASPEVIYVPSYNPAYVYGPSYYPYPPIYYPPYYAGGAFVAFGFGVMIGAAWGGAWGNCGWGGGSVNINVNNNFNKVSHNQAGGGRGGNNWQHNGQHRGGAPYGDRATANKYGGSTRGDAGSRGGASAGSMDRGGGGSRGGASAGSMDRGGGGGGASAGSMDRGGGSRGGASAGSMDRGGSGFGGGSSGFSGSSAHSASSRGSSSFSGSRSGGGGSRGGGGGGGRRR